MNKFTCFVLCVCSLFATGAIAEITVRPLNVATSVGDATIINCSSNIAGALTWLYTTDCNIGIGTPLTENNCDVISSHAAHYRTEKPDEFACNLVVFDAVLSLGGCYVCSDGLGLGRQYSALLTIVDSSARISTNATEWVSGEDVIILSNVTYKGPSFTQQPIPLPPLFYWKLLSDTSQNKSSYPGTTTSTSASSYIIVTAHPPEIPRYESHIFFNPPVFVPDYCATNAPTYTDVTVTPPYPVSYSPENISISGYPTECPYYENVDTPLKCSASGYPSPSYEWVELTKPDEILSGTDTLVIRADGIYQCTASNVIRGEVNAISTVAHVSDCFPYLEISAPSNSDSLRIVVSVIAIYFGLNLLFFIAFITCYVCSQNGRNTMNDRFPWLKKMIPCVNDQGCKCSVWIFYFAMLSILVGFLFFPTIMIISSCCKKEKKGYKKLDKRGRNGRGAGNIQMTTSGTTPYQSSTRLRGQKRKRNRKHSNDYLGNNTQPVTFETERNNKPAVFSAHNRPLYPQDRPSRPYPHSSNQQLQPTYSEYSDPYPRNLRQTSSPALSAGGVVYAELGVDNQPMSRRPIQPIINDSNAYADIALA